MSRAYILRCAWSLGTYNLFTITAFCMTERVLPTGQIPTKNATFYACGLRCRKTALCPLVSVNGMAKLTLATEAVWLQKRPSFTRHLMHDQKCTLNMRKPNLSRTDHA